MKRKKTKQKKKKENAGVKEFFFSEVRIHFAHMLWTLLGLVGALSLPVIILIVLLRVLDRLLHRRCAHALVAAARDSHPSVLFAASTSRQIPRALRFSSLARAAGSVLRLHAILLNGALRCL